MTRAKSFKDHQMPHFDDELEQTDEFDQIGEEVEHNSLHTYIEKNNSNAKYLPVSMIRKTRSPFTADNSQCLVHKQPLRYI